MLGIDLVLPDFTYLRERARGHRGDRPHPRPRGPRRRPSLVPARACEGGGDATGLRRAADDRAGALQDRGAQAPEGRGDERDRDRRGDRGRAVRVRADPRGALDPGRLRGRAHVRARNGADHRRLQVRPDARSTARRRTPRAWPSWAGTGLLLLCGDSTNADRIGTAPSEASVGPVLEEIFARCEGRIVLTSFASNIHRLQQAIDAAMALDRRVAVVGRSMRKNLNIARQLDHARGSRGRARVAEGDRQLPRRPAGRADHRQPGRAAVGAAPHVARRAPAGEAARRRHDHLLGHADPRQRARGQRDGRPPVPDRRHRHHRPGRGGSRLGSRLDRGAEADAEPDPAAVRDADPRRSQAALPARQARGVGRHRPGQHLQGPERKAARDRRVRARASARSSSRA